MCKIEAARHSPQKQFILITPQAMSNVSMGPDIHVHKYLPSPVLTNNRMRDPERGQQVIA